VRVRILVDDAESVAGDEQLFALAAQPNVAIRVFNPFRYRGHNVLLRVIEFAFSHGRLDYRMHNKLFVADGAIALVGGRNIGDQYFQVDSQSQFADEDVFASGPVVAALAATFEEYWDSRLAIPAQALLTTRRAAAAELARRRTLPRKAASAGFNYQERLGVGEPLAGVLAGSAALSWAASEVACDPPDKGAKIAAGERVGGLLFAPLEREIVATRTELAMVTPYLVPTAGELKLLEERREPQRRVRILTTSLEANSDALAQAGYMHYRVALLESGVELFELRALPESRRGSGESRRLTRSGNYSLHAKLMVFDRSGVFIGSMNYDQRSRRLNTEVGVIIHSAELAAETARRFDAMTQPQSAYAVTLEAGGSGARPRLTWTTQADGRPVSTHREPARSPWQRLEVQLLSLLHVDREL
jgi:putative cardiolipin synthase